MQRKYLDRFWDSKPLESRLTAVTSAYDGLVDALQEIDPNLSDQVQAERARSKKTLDKLEKKASKAMQRKFKDEFAALQEIWDATHPHIHAQQRKLNFTAFGQDIPYRDLLGKIYDACDPTSMEAPWIILK